MNGSTKNIKNRRRQIEMYEDLTGKRFGHLIVLGVGERNRSGRFRWECKCDCGRIISTYANALKTGEKTTCGQCFNKNGKPVDLTGMRFGRLKALYRIEDDRKETYWLCRCDCGNQIAVSLTSLRSGNTRSCGCLHKDYLKNMDRSKISHKKHGAYDKYGNCERLYGVWKGMRRRCNNPNSDSYKYYGARGIKVCDEWNNDYASFREWALEHGYNPNATHGECTIDRIDNNSNYEPNNCRFVPMKIQNSNKRKRGSCFTNNEEY